GHQHIVFDAYAAESWNVRARLNGEDHAGGEGNRRHIRARLADARLFVNVEAETVAGAVTERITKPAVTQQIARRRIYGRRVDSGFHGGNGRRVRIPDCVVHAPRLARGRTDRHRAGQVAAVSVQDAAKVQHEK